MPLYARLPPPPPSQLSLLPLISPAEQAACVLKCMDKRWCLCLIGQICFFARIPQGEENHLAAVQFTGVLLECKNRQPFTTTMVVQVSG